MSSRGGGHPRPPRLGENQPGLGLCQLEEAARRWGREKQELGTRLLEREHGFPRVPASVSTRGTSGGGTRATPHGGWQLVFAARGTEGDSEPPLRTQAAGVEGVSMPHQGGDLPQFPRGTLGKVGGWSLGLQG